MADFSIVEADDDVPPSFANGYATGDESRAPELWKGLQGLWVPPMGVTGLELRDVSGQENHGTLTNGAAWEMTDKGWAIQLADASSQSIIMGSAFPDINCSYSFWAWAADWATTGRRGGFFRTNTVALRGTSIWLNNDAGSQQVLLASYNSSGSLIYSTATTTPLVDGQWYHIVGTVDTVNEVGSLYINGQFVSSDSSWVGTPAIPETPNYGQIGRSTRDLYFDGLISYFTAYSRVLAPSEIEQLYNEPLALLTPRATQISVGFEAPTPQTLYIEEEAAKSASPSFATGYATGDESQAPELWTGLQGLWVPPLGVTGLELRDVSGQKNHGTLTNGPTWEMTEKGWAVDFGGDGTNEYAQLTRYISFAQGAEWSFEFSGYGRSLYDFGGIANDTNAFGYSKFYAKADGTMQIFTNSSQSVTSATGFVKTGWHTYHIVTRLGGITIYRDGGNEESLSRPSGPWSFDALGYRGAADSWDGPVRNFAFWSRALSPSEIQHLYDEPLAMLTPRATQISVGFEAPTPQTLYIEEEAAESAPPSFATGYATGDDSQASELWTGLKGIWVPPLGVTGLELRDVSGQENHGALTNMTADDWVMTEAGWVLDFTAAQSEYVDCGNSTDFDILPGLTMQLLIKGAAQSNRGIFTKTASTTHTFALRSENGGSEDAITFITKNASDSQVNLDSTITVFDGSWHNVVATYDGSTMRIYVDGSPAGNIGQTGLLKTSTENLVLGQYQGNKFFNGQIAQALLWDRALLPAEIEQLYNEPLAMLTPRATQISVGFEEVDTPLDVPFSVFEEPELETLPSFATGYATGDESRAPELWKGLQGLWVPSMGVTGLELRDVSGNELHGALVSSPTWVMTEKGWVLNFDGIADEVTVSGYPTALKTIRHSVTAIVRRSAALGDFDGIYRSEMTNGNKGWFITGISGNNLRHYVHNGSGWDTATTTAAITQDEWYTVTGTFTGSLVSIYLNGEFEDSAAGTLSYAATPNQSPTIGRYGSGTWPGDIAFVAVHDRALSPSEIQQLYNEPLALLTPRATQISVGFEATTPVLCVAEELLDEHPSFGTGYATGDESQAPELWQGLEFLYYGPLGRAGDDRVHDVSGYDRHGAFTTGLASIMTEYGWALDMGGDGALEYVTLPDAVVPPGSMTVAVLCRGEVVPTETDYGLFQAGSDAGTGGRYLYWDGFTFYWSVTSTSGSKASISVDLTATTAFRLITATYDADTNVLQVYDNATPGTSNTEASPSSTLTNPYLGAWQVGGGGDFRGQVLGAAIFSRALSAQEVAKYAADVECLLKPGPTYSPIEVSDAAQSTEPAAVTATWSVPAPVALLDQSTEPAAVTATWSIPEAATAKAIAPAAVSATWNVPEATTTKTTAPAAVTATWSTPEAATTKTTAIGAAVTATWSVPAVTTLLSKLTYPTPVTATWSVPEAATAKAIAIGAAVTATWSVPTPVALLAQSTEPAAVSATWSVPAATTTKTTAPAAVTAAWNVPEVTTAKVITPAAVSATWNVPAPGTSLPKVTSPASVTAAWSVPVPVTLLSQLTEPAAVSATWNVPEVTTSKQIAADPVTAAWSIPEAATLKQVATDAVSAAWNVPAPTTSLPKVRTPDPVTATWGIPEPATGAQITPLSVVATWSTPEPATLKQIIPSPVSATWSVPVPTTTLPKVRTPAPVVATWSIPSPAALLDQSTEPNPVTATWGVPVATTFLAQVTEPDAVSATWNVPLPVTGKQATPTPATATWFIPVVTTEGAAPPGSSSSSCAAYDYDTYGRQGIGVVQPQSGIDFPLVGHVEEDIRHFFADFWITYDDPADYGGAAAPFAPPFRLAWVYNQLGCLLDTVRPAWAGAPTHELDFVIKDDNDVIVFDSTTAGDFQSQPWGDRLHVYSWEATTNAVRAHAVRHTKWNADDDTFATPREYQVNILPDNAILDERVVERRPKRIKSLTAVLTNMTDTGVEFAEGYNMDILHVSETVRGNRLVQRIDMAATPGGGIGIYPGCPPEPLLLTHINSVAPNDVGDFYVGAEQCYWVRQPTTVVGTSPRTTSATPAMLQLGNDCIPCCPCDDYVATAEYLNREREDYWQLGRDAESTRDTYHLARTRWRDQKCCFDRNSLRLSLQPQICPYLDVLGQFCYTGDECGGAVTLEFNFTQLLYEGDTEIGQLANAAPVPQFSIRKGGRRDNRNDVQPVPYEMDGTWPTFQAHWDDIEPHSDIWVKFRLQFDNCGLDDEGQPVVISGCLRGEIDGQPISVPAGCELEATGSSSSSSSSSSSGDWPGIEICKEATLRCPLQSTDMHNVTGCASNAQLYQAMLK